MVILRRYPLPPPDNQLYFNLQGRGRVSTSKKKNFEKLAKNYAQEHKNAVQIATAAIQIWVNQGETLQVSADFNFHKSSVFTKAGTVKQMDVSNRLKALHDTLKDIIGVDDRLFFRVLAEKRIVADSEPEDVTVTITPWTVNQTNLEWERASSLSREKSESLS